MIVRKRRKNENPKNCNHQFLAMGISTTQETVKTAGGSASVSVCVCVGCVCCCHIKRKRDGGRPMLLSPPEYSEMFASHLDSRENVSFYSCHVKWHQIKGGFIYLLVKSNA